MLSSVYIDALAFCVTILTMLWGVVSTAIVLERKRQQQHPYDYLPMIYLPGFRHRRQLPRPHKGASGAISYTSPRLTGAARHMMEVNHIPRQVGTPDQVTIHIEPDGIPTDEQRNIQRLIQHLQKMSTSDKIAS